MTRILLMALLALCTQVARGGDYSALYQDLPIPIEEPAAPQIPALTVSLADFGGVGDGITSNTEAFRKAIASLDKQGGGHLNIPAGIWLTGPIALKSRIDLHLSKGALVLFSPDKTEFLDDKGKVRSCISASGRTDISITGKGILDGNGEWWRAVKRGKVSDVEWKDYKRMGGEEADSGKLWYPFDHSWVVISDTRNLPKLSALKPATPSNAWMAAVLYGSIRVSG